MVTKKLFCFLEDGRAVYSYRITNAYGEYVTLLDYGATIQEIVVRDGDGTLGDVVLGASPDCLEKSSYRGGTIGRCANRIAYGRYIVNGKPYQLEQNMAGHFLHGASGNYANKLFTGKAAAEENAVTFYWHDTGEGGFDCCVDAAFTFSFDDEGRLALSLEMSGDSATILNPTNHAYFNLSGAGDARNHWLQILSDRRVSRDELGLPNGGSLPVAGTPADFTRGCRIWDAMASDPGRYFKKARPSYDEFYLLDRKEYRLAAILCSPEKGRIMKVFTNMPCLILFLGAGRKPETGKQGQLYDGYCAVCLETGFVPNAIRCPQYDSPWFEKGEKLIAKTVYQFVTAAPCKR